MRANGLLRFVHPFKTAPAVFRLRRPENKLVQRGIPAEQIAFMQDYDSDVQKHVLFKEVKFGKKAGSHGQHPKNGCGHQCAGTPWSHCIISMRRGVPPTWSSAKAEFCGRAIINKSVQIYRYVTEGSFDAYMWQTLETKAKFIHQVMTGDTHIRHIEDIDSRALTYAEVKAIASGNPLVIEKASVDAEVTRLSRLRSQHGETQYRIRSDIRRLKEAIPMLNERIENLKLDMAQRALTRAAMLFKSSSGKIGRQRPRHRR
jgi:hypothetical protein